MFGYDSKLFLMQLLTAIGEAEIEIETLRQQLCALPDFDPYMVFKRIQKKSTTNGISAEALLKFMRENGYRDL
jgi:hypothetical protein